MATWRNADRGVFIMCGRLVPWVAVFLCACGVARGEEPDAAWKFDPEQLVPFWTTQTMYEESVLFVREQADKDAAASLLFEPTRVLRVTNSAGDVVYEEGRDYVWRAGSCEIGLPTGSRIVCKTPEDLRRAPGSQQYALTRRDGQGEILFGGGLEYHAMQTVVTYEHKGKWPTSVPTVARQQLPRTLAQLENKKPLTIALLGDSISTGCNASGWAHGAPFQPPYQDLFVMNLERKFGSAVTLKNFAVGGTDTSWGLANIGKVCEVQPDVVILAFGMNDSAGRPAKDYQSNIGAMVEAVRKDVPDAELILVATMVGNPDWVTLKQELFPQYRDALAELCGPGIALADMTTLWTEFLQRKQDRDLTGNGVNHPNDFGHRVYAQVLSALLIAP
jgi:lysophospholipase L1-like esterase